MDLTSYRPFGRSGLIVSPLALGTMTFGTKRWGAQGDHARAIFATYRDNGGNFIDTADVYADGRSEEMVGSLIAETRSRDDVVLATKFAFHTGKAHGVARPGNPNAGGNGRKHIHAALDASLTRLKTDYVDLYWLHFWDMVTPVEEVLETLTGLVRAGKIRYYGLSNIPAWYMTRLATLAAARGLPRPIALQTQYSLVERSAEYEHVPAASELGMGVQPWSPLAGGFLTGKYVRDDGDVKGDGRLAGENPLGQTPFTDRNWRILDTVREVAHELNRDPADVSLSWVSGRRGVASVLIGASRPEQIVGNIAALDLSLSDAQREKLDAASVPDAAFPWAAFGASNGRGIFGGTDVSAWRNGR